MDRNINFALSKGSFGVAIRVGDHGSRIFSVKSNANKYVLCELSVWVRSCFRCNPKLSGLRDQRWHNRPSENRLEISWVRRVEEGHRGAGGAGKENHDRERRRGFVLREERELWQCTGVANPMSAREEGQIERRDEKLDLQICPDYYEIARLWYSGSHSQPFFVHYSFLFNNSLLKFGLQGCMYMSKIPLVMNFVISKFISLTRGKILFCPT